MSTFKQSFCLPCFWASNSPADATAVIDAAAKIGYPAVELWHRGDAPFETICKATRDRGMAVCSMCGHQSLADGLNRRENHTRIQNEIYASIDVAVKEKIPNLIVLSGNRHKDSDVDGIAVVADGLAKVKERAEQAGVMLNLELLNSKVDHAGYQCDHTTWGVAVIERVRSAQVKLLYDIYHMQIMEGDVIRTITANLQHIGHLHTAGNPGRHELDDTQELNYAGIAAALNKIGYNRFMGHEFFALGDKVAGLKQAFAICNR